MMKSYLILTTLYKKITEINEETFIGLIEGVRDEKEALQKAKDKFKLTTVQNIIAEECYITV